MFDCFEIVLKRTTEQKTIFICLCKEKNSYELNTEKQKINENVTNGQVNVSP